MTSRPPWVSARLLEWCTPARDRAVVLGDLDEEFATMANRLGEADARRWYRRQVRRSLFSMLRNRVDGWIAHTHLTKGFRMTALWRDVTYSARSLARQPLLTTVGVASLIVGIVLCVTIFSLYNAVALRPVAVPRPADLVVLLERRGAATLRGFSYQDLVEFGAASQTLDSLVGFSQIRATLSRMEGSQVVAGELVSGNYFQALGARVRLGRGLTDADQQAAAPVVVVGDRLWRTTFGDAPLLNGQTLTLNRRALTVVGVLAPPFVGMDTGRESQFWAPLSEQRALSGSTEDLLAPGAGNWLRLIGRLRPGTSADQATQEFSQIDARLERTPNRPRVREFRFESARQGDSLTLVGLVSPLQFLLSGSFLLLVVACANAAGLMHARAHDRRAEMALRTALGASRSRVVRLLFSEAALLAGVGILVGAPLAHGLATRALPLLSTGGDVPPLDLSADARTAGFVVGLGLIAIGFMLGPGLVRVWRSSAVDISQTRIVGSQGRRHLGQGLLVTQFALAFGLLVVAMLLGRTLTNLRSMPTGLQIDRIALISVDLSPAGYNQARARGYFDAVLQALQATPGIDAAGIARVIPLAGGGSRTGLSVPGYTPMAGESLETNYNHASPTYFAAMGIDLVAGRRFERADETLAAPVALVNEEMARRFWAGRSAVGQRFLLGDRSEITVVGVVADVKYRTLREELRPSFYLSTDQVPLIAAATFHIRAVADPDRILDTSRRAVASVDPAVSITRVRTLRQQSDLSLMTERVASTIGTAMGGAAAVLASAGLFAAFAAAVGRRRRELGVRMALGASPSAVRAMVLREARLIVGVGSVVGVGFAWALGHLVRSRLYGVDPSDAASFAAATVIVSLAALSASWWPARRAAAIDPVLTLRSE